jgi:hypothetical protein
MRWSNVIEWREADALLALDMMKSSLRTACKRHSSIEAKDFGAIVECLSGAFSVPILLSLTIVCQETTITLGREPEVAVFQTSRISRLYWVTVKGLLP